MDTEVAEKAGSRKKLPRWTRKLLWGVAVAIVGVVVVWAFFLKLVRTETDALTPELQPGSHVLLYRLARSFEPGDIIVYRHNDGRAVLARVIQFDKAQGQLVVGRNNAELNAIPVSKVVGRAIWNSR